MAGCDISRARGRGSVRSRADLWDCLRVALTSDLVAFFAQREPIFHGSAWPRTRAEIERLVTGDFWEVGASGAVYTREHVLDVLPGSADEMDSSWRVDDLKCRELADGAIAVTYILHQPDRVTRRLTIWCQRDGQWRVAYHQGTIVQAD